MPPFTSSRDCTMVSFLAGDVSGTVVIIAWNTNATAAAAYIFYGGGSDILRLATVYHLARKRLKPNSIRLSGSKLVGDQLRTSFAPDSVMEFGFYTPR